MLSANASLRSVSPMPAVAEYVYPVNRERLPPSLWSPPVRQQFLFSGGYSENLELEIEALGGHEFNSKREGLPTTLHVRSGSPRRHWMAQARSLLLLNAREEVVE
jgi:hypothetical protein